jgi:hypothetical protein
MDSDHEHLAKMILLVNALNWPHYSSRLHPLNVYPKVRNHYLYSFGYKKNHVNQSSSGRVMLYVYEGVIRVGCAAVTLCGFSFARDGRDAANGLFDAAHSFDCCADRSRVFLRRAYAPYYALQFRAAMMKRACRATGECGSASKIISTAAGNGGGSSKSSAVVLTPNDR